MTKAFQDLSAEVADLNARLGKLERWERARLVKARIELANTPEAREESARQNQRVAAIFTAQELRVIRDFGLGD